MAGSKEDAGGSSVIIKLTADDNIKEIRERTITLTESDEALPIGRASKVATKGFVAAADNAWFDSPVMSRNHAEIAANFDDKTVVIRDVGSLHGTFINGGKERIDNDNPVELRDGCQVTFGVPILRNSESFAPATMTVGITHVSGTKPSRAPGSTFALPEYVDDELSSSDEESVELEGEPAMPPSKDQDKQDIVDLTEGGRQVTMVDLTDKDMSSDIDRTGDGDLIDLTSPPRAASPEMEQEEENEEDLRILRATAMILDEIVDNISNREEASDMASPSSRHSVAEAESDGSNSDVESDSTDSEVGMDYDCSDDDEGSDGDSEDREADCDAKYSSDDDVLDEDDPDTAVWGHAEEARIVNDGPFVLPACDAGPLNATYGRNQHFNEPVEHDTPINHPSAFAGPYPVSYYPMSDSVPVFDSRPMLPFPFNPPARRDARLASPSDAVLPKRTAPPTSLQGGKYLKAVESLGDMTGKHEFFAARAENKRRAFAPSLYSRLESPVRPVARTRPAMDEANHAVTEKSSVAEAATATSGPAETEKPTNVEKAVLEDRAENAEKLESAGKPVETPVQVPIAEKPASEELQQPARPAAAATPSSSVTNQIVTLTPLLRTGDEFLNSARPSVDLDLPALPLDDLDEPISAYELQKRKVAAQKTTEALLRRLEHNQRELLLDDFRYNAGSSWTADCTPSKGHTRVDVSDLVDGSPVPAAEPEEQAQAQTQAQAPVAGKGKRKADEMAELTEHEIQWEATESKLMGHLRAANKAMLHAPLDGSLYPLSSKPRGLFFGTSSQGEPIKDVPAPKRLRLRKIAERLGYAALGGATVGAALVSTLIYTAPTFT